MTKHQHISRTLGIAALALSAQAHAVVEAGHWRSSSVLTPADPTFPANFTVGIDQTVGGDETGVLMNYTSGVLKGVTYAVDEGADIFVLKPGEVFSNESIASSATPFIYGVSTELHLPTSTVVVGQDFYLGTRTRSSSDPGFFPYSGSFFSSFGWAHFKVGASGTLELLDSAMAFREGGIVVGTLQAVPEPSTVAMMGLGLLGLAWRARRRAHTTG